MVEREGAGPPGKEKDGADEAPASGMGARGVAQPKVPPKARLSRLIPDDFRTSAIVSAITLVLGAAWIGSFADHLGDPAFSEDRYPPLIGAALSLFSVAILLAGICLVLFGMVQAFLVVRAQWPSAVRRTRAVMLAVLAAIYIVPTATVLMLRTGNDIKLDEAAFGSRMPGYMAEYERSATAFYSSPRPGMRGPVVVVDVNSARTHPLYRALPERLVARTPEEASTLVLVGEDLNVMFWYDGKYKDRQLAGFEEVLYLTIMDLGSGEVLLRKSYRRQPFEQVEILKRERDIVYDRGGNPGLTSSRGFDMVESDAVLDIMEIADYSRLTPWTHSWRR